MPILTKPTITKGTPATFTLNKSLLAALPSVTNDTYFSNQSNWNKIVLSFKSATGSQNEVVVFDATSATPTGTFLISLRARDAFNIIKIDIYDFDNGGISIPRSALNAAEFDIDMGVAPSLFLRDFSSPSSIQSFETMTSASISGNVLNCYKAPYSAEYTNTQSISNLVAGDSYKVRVYINAMSSHPDYAAVSDDYRFGISLEIGPNGNPSQVIIISGSQMRSAIGSFHEATFTASSLNVPSSPIKMLTQIYFGAESFSINKIEIFAA